VAAGVAWVSHGVVRGGDHQAQRSGGSRTRIGIAIAPGGIFQARNTTLKSMIVMAYDVRDFQASGELDGKRAMLR
jgi:hypothetical protein